MRDDEIERLWVTNICFSDSRQGKIGIMFLFSNSAHCRERSEDVEKRKRGGGEKRRKEGYDAANRGRDREWREGEREREWRERESGEWREGEKRKREKRKGTQLSSSSPIPPTLQ